MDVRVRVPMELQKNKDELKYGCTKNLEIVSSNPIMCSNRIVINNNGICVLSVL